MSDSGARLQCYFKFCMPYNFFCYYRNFCRNFFKTKVARVLHAIFANEDGLQWPFDTYCLTLMRDVQKITDNDIKTFF